MDKLIELLISSGPPALLILVGLVWGKNLIEYFFKETIEIKKEELAQNLENHKMKIEQENKAFQHQLDAKLQEFNIKFSSLHSERADIIKNLYAKLIELQSSMYVFTRKAHIVREDLEKEQQDRIDRVNKALSEFTNYFLPNKIYFSKSISNKVEEILNEYYGTGNDFVQILKFQKYPNINKVLNNIENNKWGEIADKVETFFPPLIEEIEEEFRLILGVN